MTTTVTAIAPQPSQLIDQHTDQHIDQDSTGGDMNEDRIETFSAEIGELKLSGARADRERWLLAVGVVALLAGVALAVAGGLQASSAEDQGDQIAFIASGSLIGLVLVLAGVALFVRYSIARFLRFWLVRLVHEHRSETDRIVAALDRLSPAATRHAPTGTESD